MTHPQDPNVPYTPQATPAQPSSPPTYPLPVMPRARKPMGAGIITAIVLGAVLAVCVVIGGVAALFASGDNEALDPAAAPGTAPVTGTAGAPPAQPVAQPAQPSPSSPPALQSDQVFTGGGDKVIKLKLEEDDLYTATITYSGGGNFTVWAVDAAGEQIDLLVNVIGKYSGTRPVNFDRDPVALKIGAGGSWKVTVKIAAKSPVWSGKSSGKGAAVLLVNPAQGGSRGLMTARFTHNGRGNVSMIAWGDNVRDLMVNEIGAYSGEILVPPGTLIIAIDADGSWVLEPSG